MNKKNKNEVSVAEQLAEGFKQHVHQNTGDDKGVPQLWGKPKFSNLQLEGVRDGILSLISLLKGETEISNGVKLKSNGQINLNIVLDGDKVVITTGNNELLAMVHYIINLNTTISGVNMTTDSVEVELKGFPNPSFKVVS